MMWGSMTTTAEATAILSEAFGAPEASVALTAKHLRGSGHWPTGKRGGGKGAARVRTEHIVNLALALLSGAPLAQAADSVSRLAALHLQGVDHLTFETFPDGPANAGFGRVGPVGEWRSATFRRGAGDQWTRDRTGLVDAPAPGPLPNDIKAALGHLPQTCFADVLAALVDVAVTDSHAVLRLVDNVAYDASARTATLRIKIPSPGGAVPDSVTLRFEAPAIDRTHRYSLLAAALNGDANGARAPLRAVHSLPAEAFVVMAEIERGSRDALGLLLDNETGKKTAPQAVTHGADQDTSRACQPDNEKRHPDDTERNRIIQSDSGNAAPSGVGDVSRSASQPPAIERFGDVFRQKLDSASAPLSRIARTG